MSFTIQNPVADSVSIAAASATRGMIDSSTSLATGKQKSDALSLTIGVAAASSEALLKREAQFSSF